MLRVVLVDDHEVVRMGLRLTFDDIAGVRLVGEGSNAEEAVALCEELKPDIVIMDIRMPGQSGIDACQEIRTRWPTAIPSNSASICGPKRWPSRSASCRARTNHRDRTHSYPRCRCDQSYPV